MNSTRASRQENKSVLKIEEPGKGENNRFKRLVVKAFNRSTLFASSSVNTAIIKPIIIFRFCVKVKRLEHLFIYNDPNEAGFHSIINVARKV
jgi:hypothetical protein